MKILIIGASGDIGQVVCDDLGTRHDLIRVSRSSGDINADIGDRDSLVAMYDKVGTVDAVVSATGTVHFGRLPDFTHDQMMIGLNNKVMGQINLVLTGLNHVAEGGSFTLTSGILDRDPIIMGVGPAVANAALGGFVVSAALDMPHRQRINVVSPGLLEVSEAAYRDIFHGHEAVSSKRVALAYAKSVQGAITGQVITVD